MAAVTFNAALLLPAFSINVSSLANSDFKKDTFSFTTNCVKGPGNATVESGGNFLVRMYLPNDPSAVKKTADVIRSMKGVGKGQ